MKRRYCSETWGEVEFCGAREPVSGRFADRRLRPESTLMATRAVLFLVVVGGHFEHVVTLDANAVNLRLVAGRLLFLILDLTLGFGGFTHGWILARRGMSEADGEGVRYAA